MPSIKDVARLAGVSYTTVSHVINNTRYVKEETRKQVEKAIEKLGYRPSQTARSLRKGRSRTIGVIDASISDFFFLEVMRYAQKMFEEENYNLYYSFCAAKEDESELGYQHHRQRELEYMEQLVARDVEAIIFNPINPDPVLQKAVKKYQIPFLSFQRYINCPNCTPILSDDFQGGYLAADYLLSLGHQDIGVVYGFTYPSHSAADRRTGIISALEKAGIGIKQQFWQMNCYHVNEAYKQTQNLLSLPNPPTAIIYYSDFLAMAGMRAIRDSGLKVPDDISIIGYDNIQLSQYTSPGLTTINQDKEILGCQIAKTALACINKKTPEKQTTKLPVELIIRESCKKYKLP